MKIEKIKPIPKYILQLIKKAEEKNPYSDSGYVRYYSYFAKNDGELVEITVACKNRINSKRWRCKQVVVHGIHSEKCFLKDIVLHFMGNYSVGWFDEGLQKCRKWYESEDWGWQEDRYFYIRCPILNKQYLLKFPEYKYSVVQQYPFYDIFKYLRLYEKYPQAEMLIKFGLCEYATSVQILRKVGKNKAFRKWLIQKRKEIYHGDYYVSTVLLAYKMNKPLDVVQEFEQRKKAFCRDRDYKPIRELFRGKLEQFFSYIDEKHISPRLYLDYLNACNYLNLDMAQNKNRIPHDFQHWHDTRIEQYRTLKFIADEKERKVRAEKYVKEQAEKFKRFSAVAKKYLALQGCENESYEILIAKSPAELIEEGRALSHCVGGMGYDNKMIDERSLIFFVRKIDNLEIPFVTLEYSPKSKSVLQCYAYNNQRPDASVLDYVYNVWLPYANCKITNIKKKKAKRNAA